MFVSPARMFLDSDERAESQFALLNFDAFLLAFGVLAARTGVRGDFDTVRHLQ